MRFRNIVPLGLLLCLLTLPAVGQQGVITSPGGQGPNGTLATTGTVSTTSTKITLTAPSQYIVIVNTSANVLYYSPVTPATTSSFPIVANAAYSYVGVPLSSFYLIGSSSGTTYGIIAH